MMRCIKRGKVSVVYTPTSPHGWYTANNSLEMIFDPKIVSMVLEKIDASIIEKYCLETYGEGNYKAAGELDVKYITPCDKFIIVKGIKGESFILNSEFNWIESC